MAETPKITYTRSYFYIGGEYHPTKAGHVLFHHMYVEKLCPLGPPQDAPSPIVFIHGGGQTGTNWLEKPNGEAGWAEWFVKSGYEVYIVDQPHTGRSPHHPVSEFPRASFSVQFIQERFTAIKGGSRWPQARLHTQWPGTGMMGDPYFDAYYASTSPTLINTAEQERTMRDAGIALLDKIGPAVLITHSQGGLAGWLLGDARPNLVKALIQIEPKGPPFREAIFSDQLSRPWGLTSIPLTYPDSDGFTTASSSPLVTKIVKSSFPEQTDCILQAEPARQLTNLKNIPILIVTSEASYHAMYDHCFVNFLTQAGCSRVEHLELWKIGIRGNGHLMFLEKNSDVIVSVLEQWIKRTVGSR